MQEAAAPCLESLFRVCPPAAELATQTPHETARAAGSAGQEQRPASALVKNSAAALCRQAVEGAAGCPPAQPRTAAAQRRAPGGLAPSLPACLPYLDWGAGLPTDPSQLPMALPATLARRSSAPPTAWSGATLCGLAALSWPRWAPSSRCGCPRRSMPSTGQA